MKKIVAIACLSIIILTSCSKERTCECTTTNGSLSSVANNTVTGTKSEATQACEAQNASTLGITKTCVLLK